MFLLKYAVLNFYECNVQLLLIVICFLGQMTDLYIDKCKFEGRSVVGKIPMLLTLLSEAEIDYILDFFDVPPLTVSTMCVHEGMM